MLKALGIEWPKKADISVPVGGSSYVLSAEAQQHIRKEGDSKKLYKAGDRSVLIIQEPHEYLEGQINLFHGLEIFFRDNPELAQKTIFLSEGYPADQLISVQPLIDTEPHPSDDLIHEVLGTFLITGYMAYEWKHQQGIPIVGTEEEWLYFMGRDFNNMYRHNPKLKIGQFGLKGMKPVDITTELMFDIACLLRNKKITETFFDKMKYYENPLLFVGGGHLSGKDEWVKALVKYMANMGFNGPFHEYATLVEKEAEVKGIAHYLMEEKVCFTYLNPIENPKEAAEDIYLKLFEFQQQGENENQRRENHRQYVEWLISRRKSKQKTTTKASPEAAAEYVKAIQNETIFEAKKTFRKGGWFQVSVDLVRQRLGQDTMWDKGIALRGGNFEKLVEANLASNCPVIDHYDAKNQSVISLKSMDLGSGSYVDREEIGYMIGRYIEDLNEFDGIHWTPPGASEPIIISRDEKIGQVFKHRILEVAIPLGLASTPQRDELNKLQAYAETVGVILDIIEVP